MNLSRLLIAHAVVTFAASAVLILRPELIPGTVGAHVDPGSYLVCYLLGTAELGIAFLSYCASKLVDLQALRLIAWTFVVFHTSTGLVEIYALVTQGLSKSLWGNVALRVVVSLLFAYYGVYKTTRRSEVH